MFQNSTYLSITGNSKFVAAFATYSYMSGSSWTELCCHLFTKSRSSLISRILNRGTRDILLLSCSPKPIDFPVATLPFPYPNTCVSERANVCVRGPRVNPRSCTTPHSCSHYIYVYINASPPGGRNGRIKGIVG